MTKPRDTSSQGKKFEAAARAAECDESEDAFDAQLKRIAKPAAKPVRKGKVK